MTIIWAMLIGSLVPTGHAEWLDVVGMPAWCYFNYNYDDGTFYVPSGLSLLGPSTPAWGKAVQALILAWSIGLLTFVYFRMVLKLLGFLLKMPVPPRLKQIFEACTFLKRVATMLKMVATILKRVVTGITRTNGKINDVEIDLYNRNKTWRQLLPFYAFLTIGLTIRNMFELFKSFIWHVSHQLHGNSIRNRCRYLQKPLN